MDSSDNVAICWLHGLGIFRNKSWLLKSHMADAQCVNCLKVCRCGIQLFNHSITQETSLITHSCWRTIMLMLCTLQVSAQPSTSFDYSLSAMSIGFGIPMNCISCSCVMLKAYFTGCSNTSKLEMWRINLTIDTHRCHDIPASSTSLNHSID